MKTLGQGGFGRVDLGIHKVTKEKVAIKFINTTALGYYKILLFMKY